MEQILHAVMQQCTSSNNNKVSLFAVTNRVSLFSKVLKKGKY